MEREYEQSSGGSVSSVAVDLQDSSAGNWTAHPVKTGATLPERSGMFEVRCHRELSRATDVADLMQRVLVFVEEFGFTDYLFIRVPKQEGKRPLVIHPGISCRRSGTGLWNNQALLDYAARSEEPIFQTVIDNYIASAPFTTESIKKNRKTQRVLSRMGFYECYNVPIGSVTGSGSVLLSLTVKNASPERVRQQVKNKGSELEILARAIDLIGSSRFPQFFLGSRPENTVIQPRPLLLLNILAKENITLEEAATRLGVTVNTANKQIAAVRKAFGAKTNYYALFKAMQAGLVE